MSRRTLFSLVGVAAFLLVALPAYRPTSTSSSVALKSHHLLNLPATVTEADFVGFLQEMNGAVAESGYPHAGYRLWKVSGEQAGEYAYLFEGSWPSQAAYDSIHAHPAWRAAEERLRTTYDAVAEGQVYNRYLEIPVGMPTGH